MFMYTHIIYIQINKCKVLLDYIKDRPIMTMETPSKQLPGQLLLLHVLERVCT